MRPIHGASPEHHRLCPLQDRKNLDSGGERGVPAETYFNMPMRNKDKIWCAADCPGQFHFWIADKDQDWQEGTEQYRFIEDCLASVNRQRQPWLIFLAHRALGYSSGSFYATEGTFAEPESRDQVQKLWRKYKNQCVSSEKDHYFGKFNATIHVVVGGGGSGLATFTSINMSWSLVKDYDFAFTKLISFNRSSVLFECKRNSDGKIYDKFWIEGEYKDVLGCDANTLKT